MGKLEHAREQADHLGNYLTTRATMAANRMAEFNDRHPIAKVWLLPILATVAKGIASNLAAPIHENDLLDWLGRQITYASPLTNAPNGIGRYQGAADLARIIAATSGIGTLVTQGAYTLYDRLTQKDLLTRRKEGREALTSRAILTIDLTNQKGSGNYEGEGVIALRKHKEKNPEMWRVIESSFGPICEIVRNEIPQPVNMPKDKYLRLKGEDFRDEETLEARGAGLASAILLDLLDRSHTVFDSDPKSQDEINIMVDHLLTTCSTVETIQAKLQGKEKIRIPKIAIINDREHIRHTGVVKVDANAAQTTPEHNMLIDSFPSYQGFDPILAEKAVVEHLLPQIQGKKVALITPMGGEEIVKNFHKYIQKYIVDNKIVGGPEFIFVEEEKMGESLRDKKPDMIFIIGERDSSVAGAAENIIRFQSKSISTGEDYPACPVLTFLEGHTSDPTIKRVNDFIESEKEIQGDLKLNTIYLHDILANEVAEKLHALALAKLALAQTQPVASSASA